MSSLVSFGPAVALTLPPGWDAGWQGQALRFVVVGVSTAVLDFGVLAGLTSLGLSPYLARPLSILVALVAAWQLNRRMTFRTGAPPTWAEFLAYAGTAAVGAFINFALYSGALLLGAPLWLAFVIGTAVASVFNFLRYRIVLAPR